VRNSTGVAMAAIRPCTSSSEELSPAAETIRVELEPLEIGESSESGEHEALVTCDHLRFSGYELESRAAGTVADAVSASPLWLLEVGVAAEMSVGGTDECFLWWLLCRWW
jgi:hypothetical protein